MCIVILQPTIIPISIWMCISLYVRGIINTTIHFTRGIKICIIVSVHELFLNFKF